MTKRSYSIIVVTLNNAKGLECTLENIQQLDYAQKEVIVIDGASNDNTADVVSNHKDIVTTFISEKDSGIYNAMNKGLKLASGDYIVYMNAGDKFADADVLSLVSSYDGDIILGCDEYGGKVRMVKEHMTLYDILTIGIYHQAVYYRKEILQKYGFDETYKIIADLKSVVEPLAKDKISITSITKVLAICESGGISKHNWKDSIIEKQRIIDEVVDPFYREDYQKFSRINNGMIDDFIVLSHFSSIFPVIRLLTKITRLLNKYFKHIPI